MKNSKGEGIEGPSARKITGGSVVFETRDLLPLSKKRIRIQVGNIDVGLRESNLRVLDWLFDCAPGTFTKEVFD